jgi:hypothetical protein
MLLKRKNIFLILIFVFSAPAIALPYGLALSKTSGKTSATIGDTVTFCLSIIPQDVSYSAKADIMWVIDVTASMGGSVLNTIKNNISYFTGELESSSVDYRQGLLSYRDTYTHMTYDADVNYGFASTDSQFLTWVDNLTAYGGGDTPESGLDALADAADNNTWRSGASKMLVLITDTRVKCIDDSNGSLSMTYTAAALYSDGFSIYPISYDWTIYGGNPKRLASLTGGTWLNLTATADEWASFLDSLLSDTGRYYNVTVTDTLPSALSFAGSACDASINGNLAAWDMTYIPAGNTYTVCCFTAYVNSAFSGCVYNTAYVYADGVSLTASNTTRLCYISPTVTKTITLTRTSTPTFTMTPTATLTFTPTFSPTCPGTYTATATSTPTYSETSTYTITRTPTFTPTCTGTPTSSATASPTYSRTSSYTVTRTTTSTATITVTATYSPTGTFTPTVTPTSTATCTGTPTYTVTISPTVTPTPMTTPTPTPTPDIPLMLELKGSFPNPFSMDTDIVYWLSRDADVRIKIFTVSGEVVKQAAGIAGHAGYNSFYWDGRNNSGKETASGVFIYKITASTATQGERSVISKCACVK